MLVGALLGSRAALHAEGPCCAVLRRHPLAGSCSPGGGWRGYCLMPPPRPPQLPRADTRHEVPAHPSVQELRSFPPRATSWDPWASWISCRASEQQHRTAQRSRRPQASAWGLTAPRRGTARLERKARCGDTSRKPPRQSLAACMHPLQVPRGYVQHDLQREGRVTVLWPGPVLFVLAGLCAGRRLAICCSPPLYPHGLAQARSLLCTGM